LNSKIGGETLSDDMRMWWARLRGKENPLLKIGEKNFDNQDGDYIWALRDINLKVEQGDILGIIGANGAGKSTLLKILSRITGPSTGKVKIKGRIGSLLEVGTGFHPELTGRENVYLNGAILGMRRKEIDEKFDEIVDFSGVEKYIDTPVKRYSSGMRVRLGFAVAAHLDPEILVVDEVLAVGDAEFQKKCLGKMSDVAGEGRTVLFVSHNMGSVENLCKNGVMLQKGEITYRGSQTDVIDHYLLENNPVITQKLIEREDRTGNGQIRFTDFKILDDQGNIKKVIKPGDNLNIALHYVADKEYPLHDVNFGFNIINERNILVSIQSMHYSSNFTDGLLPKKGSIVFHVDELLLNPSTYSINIAVKLLNDYADRIDNAAKIFIEQSDYYGTGKIQTSNQGIYLLKGKWSIEPYK
jgi:lipopolysaccharide transport system ATP-binding protein